jgi:hypothetical protein
MDIDVKDLVRQLTEGVGMSPQEVAEALDNRVSPRTIYRWAKGESVPGNTHDLEALQMLVQTRSKKEATL